ncbi:MAG: pyridoxamine 5'-phosphate oxidase [Deltaproteobacteria bacterium]|nr:pyridoxamine 5'-phosphate oxidase [Deltaproteobacteria bacterium]
MTTSMSQQEKEQFLSGVHVGVISIAQAGRAPLAIPIWYAYEPGKEICFVTGGSSRKGKALKIGSQVSLCAQEEQMPYKYVSVEGVVSAIEPASVERDIRPLVRRYYGQKGGDDYITRVYGSGTADGDLLVRIRPEHWVAADYSRM